MATTQHSELVNVFYNTHPISESQVLDKLAQTGVDTSILTVELLQHHDQDHFGGLAATDALATMRKSTNQRTSWICAVDSAALPVILRIIMVAGLPGWI